MKSITVISVLIMITCLINMLLYRFLPLDTLSLVLIFTLSGGILGVNLKFMVEKDLIRKGKKL